MYVETFDETHDEAIEEPYEPPGILEVILKGLMIIFGIIGFLGYVRWTQSSYEPGYRIGSAAIG